MAPAHRSERTTRRTSYGIGVALSGTTPLSESAWPPRPSQEHPAWMDAASGQSRPPSGGTFRPHTLMGLDIEGQHRGVGDVRPDARRQLVAGASQGARSLRHPALSRECKNWQAGADDAGELTLPTVWAPAVRADRLGRRTWDRSSRDWSARCAPGPFPQALRLAYVFCWRGTGVPPGRWPRCWGSRSAPCSGG